MPNRGWLRRENILFRRLAALACQCAPPWPGRTILAAQDLAPPFFWPTGTPPNRDWLKQNRQRRQSGRDRSVALMHALLPIWWPRKHLRQRLGIYVPVPAGSRQK